MKGGLTSLLYALRVIQKKGFKSQGKITFSLVPDEETGGDMGTRYLVERKFLPKGIMGMLMPEPTSRVIWNANKGALTYRISLQGRSAHAALESQGENAFKYLIDIAQSLFSLRKMIKKRKTKIPVSPPDANRSSLLIGGQTGSGASFNVVPENAFFTIDRRINPEESLDEAKKEIEAVLDDYRKKGVSLKAEIIQEGESSFADPESELALVLKQSIEEVTSETARFELCPGLCEIRFFNRLGIPSYAYGPGLLEAAHSPNECVDINQVLECAVICTLTAYKFLGD
jgi:succinyl-diaminopimelate desuccinylase